MAVWRFLLVFALAFGSVVPHCGAAPPVPASHHDAMAHDQQRPDHHPAKAHVSDACIGCANPMRLALVERVEAPRPAPTYSVFLERLTDRQTVLDPPPPRLAA